jgi:membrane protease YdiL (CAAX protease family)
LPFAPSDRETPMDVPPYPDPPPQPADPLAGTPPVLLPASDLPPLVELEEGPTVLLPAGPPPAPPLDKRTILFFGVLGVGAILYVLMFVAGGRAAEFAGEGVQVLPFLGLVLLAYAGERRDVYRVLAIVYWGLMIVVAALFISLFTAMAAIDLPKLFAFRDAAQAGRKPPGPVTAIFLPGGPLHTVITLAACFGAGLAGAWAYSRTARQAASRVLSGFDANSFVHAVALATVVALTLMLFAPLAATGEPPLLTFINHLTSPDLGEKNRDFAALFGDKNMLVEQVYSFAWLVPMCVLAVGWPLWRTLPAALRRVGFVVPNWWHVPFGLGLAAVMAFAMLFVDKGIGSLFDLMHWPRTDETAVEQLFKAMTSVPGAIVIGVTAGVGEELFARGVLQPRLGILLSNLFFTGLHALQYSWDGLLSVFLIGLVLGLVRKKTNTTTSAIVHGTYDFLLVMLAVYPQYDPTKLVGW